MTKLTTERLEKLQDDLLQFQDHYSDPADKENYDIFVDALHVLDEFKAAKEKLLTYEQAAKTATAITTDEEMLHVTHGSNGQIFAECRSDDFERKGLQVIKLYAAPVLPKQPELPQGFTYESGILTANFGSGDILISDTHWPETGHAGISFAPVPQPKRPNLSAYTDLMGGMNSEDIGAIFIVKSNSAESLIAIRNKLDIAINALSPAPAQPVGELRARAIALYKPPFKFDFGYIWDADGQMVADQNLNEDGQILRVRGWGRISYLENPEALQDEVGEIIAIALSDYWNRNIEAAPAQESE